MFALHRFFSFYFGASVAVCLIIVIFDSSVLAQRASDEYREAVDELSASVRRRDTGQFLESLALILDEGDRRSLKLAVDSYARLADALAREHEWADLLVLHNQTASAFSGISKRLKNQEPKNEYYNADNNNDPFYNPHTLSFLMS